MRTKNKLSSFGKHGSKEAGQEMSERNSRMATMISSKLSQTPLEICWVPAQQMYTVLARGSHSYSGFYSAIWNCKVLLSSKSRASEPDGYSQSDEKSKEGVATS